jgi:hypothetical protein
MKLAPTLFCALLGCCAFLAGCNSGPRLSGVTATLAGIRPADAKALDAGAILTLRYVSENVNALGFSGSTHKFYLNGSYVGKATSNEPVGLPPLGAVTQEVTVIFEKPEVVRQAVAAHGQPPAQYRLESVMRFTDGEEHLELKSNFEGIVNLRGLEPAAR